MTSIDCQYLLSSIDGFHPFLLGRQTDDLTFYRCCGCTLCTGRRLRRYLAMEPTWIRGYRTLTYVDLEMLFPRDHPRGFVGLAYPARNSRVSDLSLSLVLFICYSV